ncbi:hypothetical protein SynPROSU1_01865 [Synechococcus sp. PROS-U-1]|nr:hypothetical protein SynPROSU1_01865 [Synechococcus sp. PROS-U-1]
MPQQLLYIHRLQSWLSHTSSGHLACLASSGLLVPLWIGACPWVGGITDDPL